MLLVLFAVGHTLGFRQSDPAWGIDSLIRSMQSLHLDVQGFSRTYWDLFTAAGFSVGVFYLFAAIFAWQLGGLAELALPFYAAYYFFRPHYFVPDGGGMALSEALLKDTVSRKRV